MTEESTGNEMSLLMIKERVGFSIFPKKGIPRPTMELAKRDTNNLGRWLKKEYNKANILSHQTIHGEFKLNKKTGELRVHFSVEYSLWVWIARRLYDIFWAPHNFMLDLVYGDPSSYRAQASLKDLCESILLMQEKHNKGEL